MSQTPSQVLVVGAGPVGLTMAAELARYGVPVRIVDRSPEPSRTSKALVVWSRTLELMDRMGCTSAFLAAGLRAHGVTLRDGPRILGHAGFDRIASPYAFALMVPQSETERLLAEHLAGFGVTVERSVELTGFAEQEDGITARLRHADGREESVATPWLVGCDGAHSAVRHGLGVAFRGEPQPDVWMLADVRLDGEGRPPADEIATWFHADGPFAVFPIPGGRARVIATVGRADPAHPAPEPTLAEVQALIDRRTGGGFRAQDPVWLSNFRINERKVEAYRRGRAFLAGDAAHIHSPAGGQGMNTGMQDAVDLAWKLALAVRGHAGPDLLDSYGPERDAVGATVLRNATRLTAVGTLANPVAQAARNMAVRVLFGFPAVREGMATTMSETAIGYPDSPLSQGEGAGRRWAPEHHDGPAPGAGDAPRFVLYGADAARGAALLAAFPDVVEPRLRRPPAGPPLVLVRPDGYVGFTGGPEAWPEAAAYLERWTGPAARPVAAA